MHKRIIAELTSFVESNNPNKILSVSDLHVQLSENFQIYTSRN